MPDRSHNRKPRPLEIVSVGAAREVEAEIARARATAVLSLLDEHFAFAVVGVAPVRVLTIRANDVLETSDPCPPTMGHVASMLAFARSLPIGTGLAVHCHAGISRSPATAMGLRAASMPAAEAVRVASRLSPFACPNRLVVALSDSALGARCWRRPNGPNPARSGASTDPVDFVW